MSLGQNLSILANSIHVSPSQGDIYPALGWLSVRPHNCPSCPSQPLSPQDARGRILGYAVVTKSPGGTQLLCNTSSTACSLLLPLGTHTLHVTAHNTRGASSPVTITLGQGTSSQEGRMLHAPTTTLENGFYQVWRKNILACAKPSKKPQRSSALSAKGTQRPPDKVSIPWRCRCSTAMYLTQPLASEHCSNKLKNKFVLPAGRVVLCSGCSSAPCSPKISSAASASEGESPSCELGPCKWKKRKKNHFLGHFSFPAP